MQKHKIAVRELVEFILRKGDIDNRKTSNHTAQEGARIHRKLQKEAGEAYQKEVFLKKKIMTEILKKMIMTENLRRMIIKKEKRNMIFALTEV